MNPLSDKKWVATKLVNKSRCRWQWDALNNHGLSSKEEDKVQRSTKRVKENEAAASLPSLKMGERL